ncbi:hypothetical protein [Methanocella sp. MCL-LM]|uniref:hypothetical protein n=1 Tax=Methanocella sp. MCL-LM TaxID=3412035 RepID=UPI003C722478
MTSRAGVEKIVAELGEPYSAMLGIDLNEGDSAWLKWFLAAYLYAKPIQEGSAAETYQTLVSNGLTSAADIQDIDRDLLVRLLDEGGYARYDESTADRLIAIFGTLQQQYDGKLGRLYNSAKDSRDLEQRIMALGKGIGPVTVSVFLRDMQAVWPKADPEPTPREKETAKALGIWDIRQYARDHHLDRVRLETALHRYSRKLRRSRCINKKKK